MELILGIYDDKTIQDGFPFFSCQGSNASAVSHERISSLYYDTAKNDLHKAGIRFSAVYTDGKLMWVLSRAGKSISAMGDAEAPERSLPTVGIFPNSRVRKIIENLIGSKPLRETIHITYDRQMTAVEIPAGGKIQAAYDKGIIIAGRKTECISEICIEDTDTNLSGLRQVITKMTRAIPLYAEPDSKYLRGLRLMGVPEKNKRMMLDPAVSVQDGLTSLMADQTKQVFRAQKTFVLQADDPESLHQLRVQLRRLRAFLSFAKPVLDHDGYIRWSGALREWNHAMNLPREIDVLLDLWHHIPISSEGISGEDSKRIEILIRTHRRDLAEELKTDISGRYMVMLLDFRSWLDDDPFVFWPKEPVLKRFAVRRLDQWIGRMQKTAAALDTENMTELHQLRITGKKVRYIMEGLDLDPKNTVLKELKKLQDDLGMIHDAGLHAETLRKMSTDSSAEVIRRAVEILTEQTAGMEAETRRELDTDWLDFLRDVRGWLAAHKE